MILFEIFVPIQPRPWQVRRSKHFYNVNREYIWHVQKYIQSHYEKDPYLCPIYLDLVHYLPIPTKLSKAKRQRYIEGNVPHINRPDVTNLNKQIEDCLSKILFYDDKQVIMIKGKKKYGQTVGTWIRVYEYKDGY